MMIMTMTMTMTMMMTMTLQLLLLLMLMLMLLLLLLLQICYDMTHTHIRPQVAREYLTCLNIVNIHMNYENTVMLEIHQVGQNKYTVQCIIKIKGMKVIMGLALFLI